MKKVIAATVVCLGALAGLAWLSGVAGGNVQEDARFQRATEIQTQIQEEKGALAEMAMSMDESIEAALADFQVGDASSQEAVFESLHKQVHSLRTLAAEILDREEQILRSLASLDSAVAAAPASYRDVAALFRECAAAERFADIREDYLLLAGTWDRLAETTQEQSASIAAEQAEVKEFLEYVRSSARLLERLDTHLSVYSAEAVAEREQYLARVKAYVAGFESLRKHLGAFHAKLDAVPSEAAAAEPQSSEESAPPADAAQVFAAGASSEPSAAAPASWEGSDSAYYADAEPAAWPAEPHSNP